MNKTIAIAVAIADQLKNDKHWPPNDLNKVLGDDYHYELNSISNFLASVRWQLANGNPRYFFQFDTAFAKAALKQNAGTLTGSIISKTASTQPANWIAP